MAAQLRYNPSGTIINSSQISYDHGQMVVTVVVPGVIPASTCPNGYMCLWSRPKRQGKFAEIKSPIQKPIRIHQYLPVVKSLNNRRSTGSIIQIDTGASQTACYPAGTIVSNVPKPVSNWKFLWLQKKDNC
jgi:peptidase inhibitor family I36